MTRKKKRDRRRRTGSPLSSHKRTGKVLTPPLMQAPGLSTHSWLRGTLPEMIWLCSLTVFERRRVLVIAHEVLDRLNHLTADSSRVVTGSLSSFERIDEGVRTEALASLRTDGLYEETFSPAFAQALGLYPTCPGRWLIEPQLREGLRIDPEVGRAHLTAIVTHCYHGQSEPSTLAKAIYVGRYAAAGKLHLPQDFDLIPLLTKPMDQQTEEESAVVMGFIRATFGATWAMDEPDQSADAWCPTFWRSNFRLFACEELPSASVEETMPSAKVNELAARFRERTDSVAERFSSEARRIDPDLFSPDRYEVLVGICSRAIRLCRAAAPHPDLWVPEVANPILRSIVECRIVSEWLMQKNAAERFSEFKDYGRGHLKLHKLHLEDYLQDADSPVVDLLLQELEDEVNVDLGEEFQSIQLGHFAGTDLRKMAIDANLKDDYDLVFAPASAETHGEWATLDRYHLSRCGNPLHLFHRLPNVEASQLLSLGAVELMIRYATDISDRVLKFLN